ncbi:hypothetical protein WG902_09730 [Ramlibacter sp. PS3R-8]|uniref:hypothetical protein n=1 Tax=Ramlibacter sp. PS3R-8 TaxID=3133437 RepID=UPI0030A3D97D
MADVRIREAAVSMRVVDGESLLTPALLERIVDAVQAALAAQHDAAQARRRDTRLSAGGACGCSGSGDAGEGGH